MNQKGSIISRSTVQRVTNLELETAQEKETFKELDERIKERLKLEDQGYVGNKPNPEDRKDLIKEDEDFQEEFECRHPQQQMQLPPTCSPKSSIMEIEP